MTIHEVTLSSVAASLSRLYHEHQTLCERLGDIDVKATKAREDYSMAYQVEYIRLSDERENGKPLAVETRKARAFVATRDLRVKAEGYECSLRDVKQKIKSVEIGIDAARSAGSLVKAEIELAKAA